MSDSQAPAVHLGAFNDHMGRHILRVKSFLKADQSMEEVASLSWKKRDSSPSPPPLPPPCGHLKAPRHTAGAQEGNGGKTIESAVLRPDPESVRKSTRSKSDTQWHPQAWCTGSLAASAQGLGCHFELRVHPYITEIQKGLQPRECFDVYGPNFPFLFLHHSEVLSSFSFLVKCFGSRT